jgi:hypothetical protein
MIQPAEAKLGANSKCKIEQHGYRCYIIHITNPIKLDRYFRTSVTFTTVSALGAFAQLRSSDYIKCST